MSWTDERVEQLKELWAEGMSASQIAKALGGVTRNAVIGKVHRLGLSNRAAAPGDEAKPAEPAKAKAPVPEKPAPAAAAPDRKTPEVQEAPPAPVVRRTPPVIRDASQPRAPGAPTPEEEAARATLVELEKIAKRISLLELTERTCRWPIGDPTDEDFAFCGLPCVAGKPYCQYHVAVAFQPMSSRRDRNRARP